MRLIRRQRSLVVETPAKLNLFLEILAKRADGFHELETLMVSVGLYDTLSFSEEASGQIRLSCFAAGSNCGAKLRAADKLPSDGNNLVVRAARLLRDHTGVSHGVRIELQKRIPAAAGLAGGSSDAAATLMALNRFWNLDLSHGLLTELASQLGSDIPFFLCRSAAAIGRGRGEVIEPVRIPLGLYFVIVCPDDGLSTALVYQHCRPASKPRSVETLVDALESVRLSRAGQLFHNALQSAAEDLNAGVSQLCNRISRQPVLGHMMSGSGTACFGLCENRPQAIRVAARLRAARIGRVFVARCRT
ncbi:MAG: 4-(cytidine 5'-diphospho)-2-C-methyl-D-erythritol kinase [Planctomycetaceae bacterium]|jgi:4-diphosphocytidyl-2-C-methyl-D-erythritol kinase|nr:4-(cytidine 5'-diphospho)-2-C-methyl-D-erythritol kinase [Planctomycetaceae bacterium]MBT6483339.1 4-(cytidine 5'-diphospho)-2-C-methyl-D-erythritol kinase [Planctomycetaceae bacterium]MBT6493866.1 4-(cytidine 5'-diphospho)-2-C-methyl-D-erythritol kinase [Planctomycetaceae bacterium]